jgi:hypothetical protein
MRISTSLIAVGLVPGFAVDALLGLSFRISLLIVRVELSSTVTGLSPASDAGKGQRKNGSKLPEPTLHV